MMLFFPRKQMFDSCRPDGLGRHDQQAASNDAIFDWMIDDAYLLLAAVAAIYVCSCPVLRTLQLLYYDL